MVCLAFSSQSGGMSSEIKYILTGIPHKSFRTVTTILRTPGEWHRHCRSAAMYLPCIILQGRCSYSHALTNDYDTNTVHSYGVQGPYSERLLCDLLDRFFSLTAVSVNHNEINDIFTGAESHTTFCKFQSLL